MRTRMLNSRSRYPEFAVFTIALVLLIVLLASCGVPSSYLAADRATYDAIGQEYEVYIAQDQKLDLAQRERRIRTLAAWKLRIDQAAGGVK